MPRYPARPEVIAPTAKDKAVNLPSGENSIIRNRGTANIASIIYSLFMKTIAPSWIAAAIFLSALSPSEYFVIST